MYVCVARMWKQNGAMGSLRIEVLKKIQFQRVSLLHSNCSVNATFDFNKKRLLIVLMTIFKPICIEGSSFLLKLKNKDVKVE